MSKLKQNELNEILYNENAVWHENITIPADAKSVFRFDIEQNIQELLRDIDERGKTFKRYDDEQGKDVYHYGDWDVFKADGIIYLQDKNFDCSAEIALNGKQMQICTAWDSSMMTVTENPNGKGCEVIAWMGINQLLQQNLLPNMTPIIGTLEGKFIDAESGRNLTRFMDISDYMEFRRFKNRDHENPQDEFGFLVNKKFGNQIAAFDMFYDKTAQEEYTDEQQAKKERILANRDKYRNGEKSGVVKADVLAQAMINKRGR